MDISLLENITLLNNNLLNRRTERLSRLYFNEPPRGGYVINEEHEYILLNTPMFTDDLEALAFNITRTINKRNGSSSKKEQVKTNCPCRKIKVNDVLLTSSNTCSICIDPFLAGEYQRTLKCKHIFHKKCIDKWIKKDKNECPMCRTQII